MKLLLGVVMLKKTPIVHFSMIPRGHGFSPESAQEVTSFSWHLFFSELR